ncbi:MAG: TIGR00730 family Rossman fold protein [Burkholderiales bacterium]|nr:TIGR00730 family Rossman fold protein [Burkholderiales bacterium]
MKSVCVYCGSAAGKSPTYAKAAQQLAQHLVERQLELVYGGGNVGLMKVIADEVRRLGGHVTGVIPQALQERELAHADLNHLYVVANMHERKAKMAELSDGFIALPGGIGTLEELFEMFTWLQLGFHQKPLGLLNVDAYYDPLLQFLQHAVGSEFLKPEHHALLLRSSDPEQLLQQMQHFEDCLRHTPKQVT